MPKELEFINGSVMPLTDEQLEAQVKAIQASLVMWQLERGSIEPSLAKAMLRAVS